MTLTIYDESLCKILEPNVSTTYERFQALDKYFPGMKNKYIRTYGNAYDLPSPDNDILLNYFREYCAGNGIMYKAEECFRYLYTFPEKYRQISFMNYL